MSITEQTLRIGDKVVYPNHGVGVIEQISSRTIGATVEKFSPLRSSPAALECRFLREPAQCRPASRHQEWRSPEDRRLLTSGKCENHTDWKFRFKENSEKMRTGFSAGSGFVLKSLLMLNQSKPLSFREKKMLDRARYCWSAS